MSENTKLVIALVWSQFAAYHVDRCEAVAKQLQGRAEILAVEIATSSSTYAWEPSGTVEGARKYTLFPGSEFEDVFWLRRLWRELCLLRKCNIVCIGLPYSEPDAIALSWLLWLFRVRVVVMTDSKRDDFERNLVREWIKSLILTPYRAAIASGRRSQAYVRGLGFASRPVVPGYDTVNLDRVRLQAGPSASDGPPFEDRDFIFVGRFVETKNLEILLRAYSLYAGSAGNSARKLVMVGDGPLTGKLRHLAHELGVAGQVVFTGFLSSREVSVRLASSLALLLISMKETWGLTVNEAVAFGLPLIVSYPVGARDALVRDGVNGFVVDPNSVDAISAALHEVSSDRDAWRAMSSQSQARAWMADSERFADAVEILAFPEVEEIRQRIESFRRAMES